MHRFLEQVLRAGDFAVGVDQGGLVVILGRHAKGEVVVLAHASAGEADDAKAGDHENDQDPDSFGKVVSRSRAKRRNLLRILGKKTLSLWKRHMEVVDIFCGIGGFCAGAREYATPILGVDNDDLMVRLWAANTKGKGKLAKLWVDAIEWPPLHARIHIHISPPCTTLSKARRGPLCMSDGVEYLRESLTFACRSQSWSMETVSTPLVREFLHKFKEDNPVLGMDWVVLNAADYGCPSTRIRIIVGNSDLVSKLRQVPVRRVSVSDAFRMAKVDSLPAEYIKNNTKTRARRPCVRHVSKQCHTQTASHPLVWCTEDGHTVRCLNVEETAIVMGFPRDWILPTSSRAAIKALGNAVPPPLAAAMMFAAVKTL